MTILTGPNGSGKTRLLTILRAMLAADYSELARQPFSMVELQFDTGRSLRVERNVDGEHIGLDILVASKRSNSVTCSLHFSADPAMALTLPNWIRRLNDEMWEDMRDGEILDAGDLVARYGRERSRDRDDFTMLGEQPPDGLAAVSEALGRCPRPTFVRTQRLDVEPIRHKRPGARQAKSTGRIHEYVGQIQTQVEEARSSYSRIAQRADSQFASRALDKSGGDPPAVVDLRRQFNELAELHRQLLSTGLAAESPGVEMGGESLTKPERRFLSVFLSDWTRKLEPLVPVHERLQMLQGIVGSKFSNKGLRINEDGRLLVEAPGYVSIPVDQLSSGEQHLLALFAMMLFSASPGSVVLIDEPEISLHAVWKHAFLDDIRRVAEAADLHLVIATHSTAIINGQWELVEEV